MHARAIERIAGVQRALVLVVAVAVDTFALRFELSDYPDLPIRLADATGAPDPYQPDSLYRAFAMTGLVTWRPEW